MNNSPTDVTAVKPERKSRTALNFWVDTITAILFSLLLGTSIIMKWVLPPGTCDGEGVKIWMGHSRHWWGDIHFIAAAMMIVLVILHIQLHWGWVTKTWRRFLGSLRTVQTWAVILLIVGLISVPLLVPAQFLEVTDSHPAVAEHLAYNGEGIDESNKQAVPANVAPCGIEGLSCSDCPAADDRLFGTSCGEDDDNEDPDEVSEGKPACEEATSDCASCPSAESCGSKDA